MLTNQEKQQEMHLLSANILCDPKCTCYEICFYGQCKHIITLQYIILFFLKPKKFGNFAPKTCFEPHVLLIPFQHFTNAILIHIIDAGSQEKSNPPVFVVGTVVDVVGTVVDGESLLGVFCVDYAFSPIACVGSLRIFGVLPKTCMSG